MKRLFTLVTPKYRHLEGYSQLKQNSLVRMMVMAVAMMMLAPSDVKAAYVTTEYSFGMAANAAYHHVVTDANKNDAQIIMTNRDHNVGWGAKYADKIRYKSNSSTYEEFDISRLAFTVNTNGNGKDDNDGYGFYLRRDANNGVKKSGLYTGYGGSRLAVLNLKPGDKVTFTYSGASECDANANLENVTYGGWFTQIAKGQEATYTVNITSVCDFIVAANKGTVIESIKIESLVAEYDITTTIENNQTKTTFEFKGDGTLAENDFAIPYMTVSFGNAEDYLVVQNQQSHMYNKDNGTETLVKGSDTRPIGGNFYAFKPTGAGDLYVEGGIHGSCVHLFVWDEINNSWITDGEHWYNATYNTNSNHYIGFNIQQVEKDKIYYICINDLDPNETNDGDPNAFHLHKFVFTNTFRLKELAKVIDNVDDYGQSEMIELTEISGITSSTTGSVTVKRCTGNIDPTRLAPEISDGKLKIKKPTFAQGTDHAGTVILDVKTSAGDATFVATFPYHAYFEPEGYNDPNRTYGHIWNFYDPRKSDSSIGNCKNGDGAVAGTTTGLLSIGRWKDTDSQFRKEYDNREWAYAQRVTGMAGGFHDPMYTNVYEMEGDNADMIWETEGLWFDTETNLSCIYNENDPAQHYKTEKVNGVDTNIDIDPVQPTDFLFLKNDPDRYVGLLPDAGGHSSFTIPGLKDGDRVLIFMKSGEATGANGIFMKVHGAMDAVGTPINENDLYMAGGTNWQHSRYEGCYHFIKNGDGPMKFDMVKGSMAKILYIRIYQGKRLTTNNVLSTQNGVSGVLLYMNDKGAELGSQGVGSTLSLRLRGKGQKSTFRVLTKSGTLNDNSFTGSNFVQSGTYNENLAFKSKVGEMGVFRLRITDLTYEYAKSENEIITYVADFCDRNFTVGYRDKVVYPYTWDFTDVNTYSCGKITNEDKNYNETTVKNENTGWDISLFDKKGNMKVNSGVDPEDQNFIFSADKAGYGNQLWADDGVIPEIQGLWFYTDNNDPQYNDCMQITAEGIRFANTKVGSHTPNWNYKMVVPSVPKDGAVYVRMKRDSDVKDEDVLNGTPFLATKFHFGVATATEKTSLTTGKDVINGDGHSSSKYSFYKVPDTDDEYILAVLNTGDANNLTFTLNGWIVEKVAVSTDQKSVNSKGWASESRSRNIDAALTPYFTGKTIKTYLAGSPNYDNRTLLLTDISTSESNHVLPAETGCVLFNETDKNKAEIVAGNFHLFVPDMHDGTELANPNATLTDGAKVNMLKPQLTQRNPMPRTENVDGTEHTIYVLAYKYYDLDQYGNTKSNTMHEGPEMFYRIAANQSIGLKANSAYLVLPTSKVKPQNALGAKYTFVFDDWDNLIFDDPNAIATEIEGVDASNGVREYGQEGWYNMNGQKLNGRPTESGIYIVNGKKLVIK